MRSPNLFGERFFIWGFPKCTSAGQKGDELLESGLSRAVARAAIRIALTQSRDEERQLKGDLLVEEIGAAGVDYGGEYVTSIRRIVERAVVCAKREGVIGESHAEEGAVAGAAHEATQQLMPKALGLNVGGKIGVARGGEHIAVAVYVGIGLLHLDDVAIAVGHRAVPAVSRGEER